VARVAKARHVSPDQIRAVLAEYRSGRELGFSGEPAVNVLRVNLELDRRYPVTS
jgi:K+-transporting ATPase ATPase C chain